MNAKDKLEVLIQKLHDNDIRYVTKHINASIAAEKDASGMTLLHYCAHWRLGCFLIPLLIRMGANLNARCELGHSPLIDACSHTNYQTVSVLLEFGAEVNLQSDLGETALSFACARNAKRIIKKLLASGADINTVDVRGRTPLSYVKENRL
jgi:uncharacterized protein